MKKNLKKMQMNRFNFLRLLSFVFGFLLIIPVMANAQSGKANFSGSWTLNESKSKMGEGGRRFGGGDFVVKQEANLLSVERSFNDQSFTSKYTLDGKESVNSFGRGESKSTAKWSADGKSLTIVTKMNFNGSERTSTQVWTLSDSKVLSIESTRQNRDGDTVKTTMVYDKK
ncbi:hypothetical protein [Maribellus sediminis]|uniref:hypothetical protein n=1 Tax=Maribellus sediminis TaxID=2696285 RepID=UPI001431635D|nr:hypothetical protein [Maribellus sediminis]